ncbi:unnamed protein product, partial [Prorocentrum cordatum]
MKIDESFRGWGKHAHKMLITMVWKVTTTAQDGIQAMTFAQEAKVEAKEAEAAAPTVIADVAGVKADAEYLNKKKKEQRTGEVEKQVEDLAADARQIAREEEEGEEKRPTITVGSSPQDTKSDYIIEHVKKSAAGVQDHLGEGGAFAYGGRFATRGTVRFETEHAMIDYLHKPATPKSFEWGARRVYLNREVCRAKEGEVKGKAVRKLARAVIEREGGNSACAKEQIDGGRAAGFLFRRAAKFERAPRAPALGAADDDITAARMPRGGDDDAGVEDAREQVERHRRALPVVGDRKHPDSEYSPICFVQRWQWFCRATGGYGRLEAAGWALEETLEAALGSVGCQPAPARPAPSLPPAWSLLLATPGMPTQVLLGLGCSCVGWSEAAQCCAAAAASRSRGAADDGHSADGLGGHDDLSWQAILATARQEAEGPGGQPGGPAPDVVDLAAGEAAPDKAAGQSPDPMSKARLDLLVRYMASVESRGQDQGTTPQRQKLQRKLLLRMCGGGSEKGLPSAAPK